MTKKHEDMIKGEKCAGFWLRFAAFAVDFFVLILISIIAAIAFVMFTRIAKINCDVEVVSSFVGFLINAGYYIFMTYRYGATIGKKIFGIRVKVKNGKALDIGTVIVREIAGKFLSTMFAGLGYFWIVFDKQKQGLHDKISRTVVVIEKEGRGSKWKVGVISSIFAVFLITFSIWIISGVLDEDFEDEINRDQVVLLVSRTLVSGKLCVSEGNELKDPLNILGKGDICSEKIGTTWPILGAGYEYGEIGNSAVFIDKNGVAVVECRIESSKCELIETE